MLLESIQERYPGRIGYARASRREIFDTCGFYDHLILGSGDLVMAYAFYGIQEDNVYYKRIITSEDLSSDRQVWAEAMFAKVRGSVYYTSGLAMHLWHGERINRNYENRDLILKNHDFNLFKDVKKNDKGVWEWSSDKPELHQAVIDYFFERNEDEIPKFP